MAPENRFYTCEICEKKLDAENFSKRQINLHKEQGGAIRIKCLTCVKQIDIDAQESSKKKGTKKNKTPVDTSLIDPSMLYNKDPLSAPIVHEFRQFFHGYRLKSDTFVGKSNRWRTHVKLAVRSEIVNDEIETKIGLFQPGTHSVIDCTESLAHHGRINKALSIIDECIKEIKVNGYMEGCGDDEKKCEESKAFLKYIVMSVERSSGMVQLTLVWNASKTNPISSPIVNQFVDLLLKKTALDSNHTKQLRSNIFHSIWMNYNLTSRYNNAILGRDMDGWELKYGREAMVEKIDTNMKSPPNLYFPPFVFRQANIDSFTFIIQDIRLWIQQLKVQILSNNNQSIPPKQIEDKKKNNVNKKEKNSESIKKEVKKTPKNSYYIVPPTLPTLPLSCDAANIDLNCIELYGGVGTIGLNCLDLFSSLFCCDENPHNLTCFNKSLANIHDVYKGKAQYSPGNAAEIVSKMNLFDYDVVIIDPPRKGVDEDTMRALTQLPPNLRKEVPNFENQDIAKNNNEILNIKRKPGAFTIDLNNTENKSKKIIFELSDDEDTKSKEEEENLKKKEEEEQKAKENAEKNKNHYLKRLIYISCGFDAFKRDCDFLTGRNEAKAKARQEKNFENEDNTEENSNNKRNFSDRKIRVSNTDPNRVYWKLVYSKGYLLFPGSNHIETLAIFDRIMEEENEEDEEITE